jgi:tetratricopeptide (TPR) repeat protein
MDIEAVYQRGFDLRCEGRYSEATVEFEKVLATNPKHCNARWQMGLIQGFQGDFDGSLATLQGLAREFPNDLNVRNDLAMTFMMLGMIDEAGAEFREIVRMDPSHENANKQLAYF